MKSTIILFAVAIIAMSDKKQVRPSPDCQYGYFITWYQDLDNDGWGNSEVRLRSCDQPDGYVNNGLDCDDSGLEDPTGTWYIGANCDVDASCGKIAKNCLCEEGHGWTETMYADLDGDGYGDRYNSMENCIGKNNTGYVFNWHDCDDSNAAVIPGAPCSTGSKCITYLNARCNCAITDSDSDGVCDGIDICSGMDDTVDVDGDGIPDCTHEMCYLAEQNFENRMLRTNSNQASESTTVNFPAGARNVKFTVLNIGKRKGVLEKVTVTYTNDEGNEIEFGSMTNDDLLVINDGLSNHDRNNWVVDIQEDGIQSVTVTLENTEADSTASTRVTLTKIEYCGEREGADGQASLLEQPRDDL